MKAGLEQYLDYLRAIDYTAGTIRWQHSHLEAFQAFLHRQGIEDFTGVTAATIRAYLATAPGKPTYRPSKAFFLTSGGKDCSLPTRRLRLKRPRKL
jgi:site-specific recombinase XerD